MRRYLTCSRSLVIAPGLPGPGDRRRADRDRRPAHPDRRPRRPHRVERLRPRRQALLPDPAPGRRDLAPAGRAALRAVRPRPRARRRRQAGGRLFALPRASRRPATRRAVQSPSCPNGACGRGCDLYLYSFEQGREVLVRFASTRGASEFLPTVWTDRIAFARRVRAAQGPRRPAGVPVRATRTRCSPPRAGAATRAASPADPAPAPARPRSTSRRAASRSAGTRPIRVRSRRLPRRACATRAGPRSGASTAVTPGSCRGASSSRRSSTSRCGSCGSPPSRATRPKPTCAATRSWARPQEEARIPPLPTGPDPATAIAGAVDGDGYLYLASGFIDPADRRATRPVVHRRIPGAPSCSRASCAARPGSHSPAS